LISPSFRYDPAPGLASRHGCIHSTSSLLFIAMVWVVAFSMPHAFPSMAKLMVSRQAGWAALVWFNAGCLAALMLKACMCPLVTSIVYLIAAKVELKSAGSSQFFRGNRRDDECVSPAIDPAVWPSRNE